MALTVVQFETILTNRVGTLMTTVGMDGTTVDGDNPDLVDPMGVAIRHMGGSVTTITDIVDADLAGFEESDYDELFDVAEYRTLLSIQGNFALIDTEIGPRDEKWSKLGDQLEKLITSKKKQIDDAYNVNNWTLAAEIVEYDFSTLD
jgi:hypothetical protein